MKKRFFVMAAIIISSHLQAQNDTTSLDEIVVTANKYPNKSSQTGKVITIITRQQLEKSGGKDLSQLLTEQTGLYINGANSNPGKDKSVYLRGARVDHTLITIDGMPVYDASGIGGNFDIRNMPIENIERIEILKGSQSTLFGSDAIAGVINIITKKGSTSKLGGSAALSYGSNSTIKGSAGINGKQGVIDYNAGITFFDTEGINETINKNNQPGTDKDWYTQKAAQANLGFQLSKNIKLQPYFRYSSLEGAIDQGAFTDELDYDYTQKSWQGGLRTEMAFGNLKLNLLYNYNDIDRVYTDDSIKSRNGFNIWSKGQYKGSEHFIDLFAHIALNQKLKLTAGTDFRSSSSEQDYQSVSVYGNSSSQLSKDSLKQTQVSLYAALNFNNEKGFNLELGNRLNIHSEYGANDVFNINPSYLIRRRVKIFMNLSTGYRTPSLYQLFSEYGNRDLKPETAFTLEGGLQYFTRNDKFSGRAVVFSRDVRDLMFFYYNPVSFQSQYINQDKQKDYGLELEAKYSLAKNTVFKMYFNYATGRIHTLEGGKDTTYFNLLRRPKTSFGLNLGSQLTGRFYISSNLLGTGEKRDAYYDATTFSTVYTTLPSYLLWDIYAEYSFLGNKLKLFADLRNITNTEYTEVSGFNTMGFNGYGGLRMNL